MNEWAIRILFIVSDVLAEIIPFYDIIKGVMLQRLIYGTPIDAMLTTLISLDDFLKLILCGFMLLVLKDIFMKHKEKVYIIELFLSIITALSVSLIITAINSAIINLERSGGSQVWGIISRSILAGVTIIALGLLAIKYIAASKSILRGILDLILKLVPTMVKSFLSFCVLIAFAVMIEMQFEPGAMLLLWSLIIGCMVIQVLFSLLVNKYGDI